MDDGKRELLLDPMQYQREKVVMEIISTLDKCSRADYGGSAPSRTTRNGFPIRCFYLLQFHWIS